MKTELITKPKTLKALKAAETEPNKKSKERNWNNERFTWEINVQNRKEEDNNEFMYRA